MYNSALDKYLQPSPSKKKKTVKKVKQEQNLAASSITCLLWRHEVSREHFRVFCFSPLIILGKMEQKPLISYPQIFLKFLLYFMIDVMKKKIVFLIKLFSLFLIFSRREQIKIKKSQTLYFSNQNYRNYQQFNGRQMPPVFEVSNFKLILKHVFANNFLWDLHNKRF